MRRTKLIELAKAANLHIEVGDISGLNSIWCGDKVVTFYNEGPVWHNGDMSELPKQISVTEAAKYLTLA